MPLRDETMGGNAPDESPVALLIIDMINDLEYPGADDLFRHACPMAEKIRDLRAQACAVGIPVIYVNDNFGKWRSDFNTLVRHCLTDDAWGKPIAELLQPGEADYFVLKPKNSGFFSTTLDVLLKHLRSKILILTGIAGNNCILFTAADAYLRDYKLVVPSDCIASADPEDNRQALAIMEKVLKADTKPSTSLNLGELLRSESR